MKQQLVVLSGAGISAESGLKTFRDSDGLWEGYDVQDVATPRAFAKNPRLVLDFYNMRRRNVLDASPNAAHLGLAALERDYTVTIITQNVDDLHERAGSTHVIHLHGEILRMHSVLDKEKTFPITGDITLGDLAPDGSQLRPAIVWFEEEVPLIQTAATIIEDADLFVVIGTSLAVYPAAGLVHYAPANIPKYIIDKRIPDSATIRNIVRIEQPATTGIAELVRMLEQERRTP